MTPKLTRRIRNWVDKRLSRSCRRAGAMFACVTANSPRSVDLTTAECSSCRRHICRCVPVTEDPSALNKMPTQRYRILLTPGSCQSISSPESAYYTGQSEDSATPVTPLMPDVSSGKYFMLQNRDILPPVSPHSHYSGTGYLPALSAQNEYPNTEECRTPSTVQKRPARQRTAIKTNPWIPTPSKLTSSGEIPGPSQFEDSDVCLRQSLCYSSGRGSCVSDLSVGEILKKTSTAPDANRANTYASLKCRQSDSTSSSDESGSRDIEPVRRLLGTATDSCPSDSTISGDEHTARPSRYSSVDRSTLAASRAKLRNDRRRSVRDRHRKNRICGIVGSPQLRSAVSAHGNSPHSFTKLQMLKTDKSLGYHTYENIPPLLQVDDDGLSHWRPPHVLPPSIPSSEPLKRKTFASSYRAANSDNRHRQNLVPTGRPRSSLSSDNYSPWCAENWSYSVVEYSSAGCSPPSTYHVRPTSVSPSLGGTQMSLGGRRPYPLKDVRFTSSRLDDHQVNLLRRLAAENLRNKRHLQTADQTHDSARITTGHPKLRPMHSPNGSRTYLV